MPKAQDYRLTDKELQQIEKAIKHDKRAKVVKRSVAIRLPHLGNKPEEVAEMQAVSTPTCANKLQDKMEDMVTNAEKVLKQQNVASLTCASLCLKTYDELLRKDIGTLQACLERALQVK